MVIINDVGPRDGLQSQTKILSVDDRVKLISAIAKAGIEHIETGAFVSPKAVPAMAGTAEVLAQLSNLNDVSQTVLIPNQRGYELAKGAGVKKVAMVLYATEEMCQKNANMSTATAEAITREIVQQAIPDQMTVSAYIAVAFGCPFAGNVNSVHVADLTARYFDFGVDEIVLADTIGSANPTLSRQTFDLIIKHQGSTGLGAHFHDTRAMGMVNVYAAYVAGVRRFDASIAGLGGCPFASGASGNVATEDVAILFQQMGVETGVDMQQLLAASTLATELTGTAKGGRARAWLDRQHQ